MIPLNKQDLAFLYILQNKKCAVKALKAVKEGHQLFSPRRTPHLDLLWRVFVKFVLKSKELGSWLVWDKQAYVAETQELMKETSLLDENKARLQAICTQYVECREVDTQTGESYFEALVEDSIQRELSSAIASSASFEQLKSLVNKGTELKVTLQKQTEVKPLFVNPFDNVERYLHVLPKKPTGVRYFDKATNGGMSEGEIAFIAGLTGGGKSAMAIQLAGSQLQLGEKVAWFTFEQPFDQDLMQRMVSFTTGYSLDLIRGKEYTELPTEIQERFSNLRSRVSGNMLATDFATTEMLDPEDESDDCSVYSVRKRLDIWAAEGKFPAYIIFDWLGAAVKRVSTIRNVDTGDTMRYIDLAMEIILDLVQVAKEYHTRVIFFHQLSPDLKKSPPSRQPTTVELQNIKTVTNYVNYAMAIGKRDSNQRCWFICDKCRNSYPSDQVIELDGPHAKFKTLEGYMPNRQGEFVDVSKIEEEMAQSSPDDYSSLM